MEFIICFITDLFIKLLEIKEWNSKAWGRYSENY